MPINFYNMLGDDDWVPLSLDQDDPAARSLAGAPADVKTELEGNIWTTTAMDPEFRMKGIRVAPEVTFPRRSHNQHKLIVVFGGELEVEYDNKGGQKVSDRVAGPGGFFVVDENTPHSVTAGPDGATFTEQWDYHLDKELETTW